GGGTINQLVETPLNSNRIKIDSQPQNPQNKRYQPPHLRQNLPMNPPPSNYDETLRTYQQESRELREAHKKTEARLNDLTELLHKFASQMAVNNQPSPSSNPLPWQPLPNPKGGINMVKTASEKGTITEEEDDKKEEDEEDDDWLYELLAKLARESSDSEDEYEEAEEDEMAEVVEVANEEEVSSPDKEEEFLTATIYGVNEEKPEDLPKKCTDPEPCFVTCKIGKVYVPDCLCDPGASENIIVKLGKLSIPADFHVFRTSKNNKGSNPQWEMLERYFSQHGHPYRRKETFITIMNIESRSQWEKSNEKTLQIRQLVLSRRRNKRTPPQLEECIRTQDVGAYPPAITERKLKRHPNVYTPLLCVRIGDAPARTRGL
ncbi:hypothetical protein PIB30_068435, partial [Stylosanthes scabra]|nr:hypothetical protein [Stylosanthes scabra]